MKGAGFPIIGNLSPQGVLRGQKHGDDNGYRKKVLGITGLIRAFVGKRAFTGSWVEDLNNIISIFEAVSKLSELDEVEQLKVAPFMLKGDSLNYLAKRSEGCRKYADAKKILRRGTTVMKKEPFLLRNGRR